MSTERTQADAVQLSARALHLLYHELSSEPRDYTYVTETSRFAEHLYLFARLQDAPLQPRLTFDDGHISAYTHALPMLAEHNLTARFFITAGWTGTRADYLGWSELRALHQAGHSIGAHGWSHKLLTHCDDAELQRELYDSRRLLEDKLGAPILTMSFPGGRFNARVLQACEKAGYTQMFTSEPQIAPSESDRMIGRLNLHGDTAAAWLTELFRLESPVLAGLQRKARLKAFAKKLLGDKLYASLWALANKQEAGTP